MLRIEMAREGESIFRDFETEEDSVIVAQEAVAFYREGCERFILHLEDLVVTYYGGNIHCYDTLTATLFSTTLTSAQIEALLTLSITGGGDYDALASIDWPAVCNPLP